jgi:aminopeptidase
MMTNPEFEEHLAKLATIGIVIGVNLQSGQELILTAPLEASLLVHHLTKVAYQQGAKLVTCIYEDPGMIRDRFEYADDATLDYAPAWMSRGISEALTNGAARLFVAGPYPDLLVEISADKILRSHTASALASQEEMRFTSNSRTNWSVLPAVTASWAKMVFSGLTVSEAVEKLWRAVFDATRASHIDPIGDWHRHRKMFDSRREILQTKKFDALHFYDGRTNLRVGLAEGHQWVGGSTKADNGIESICNIPSEETFTCPHRDRVDGKVFCSKTLVIAGTLIDEISIEFRGGLAASIRASKGRDLLEKLISAGEGAGRLGEIALVANSSPISRSKTLFYSALFDENAASHFAFGQPYGACLQGSSKRPAEVGANKSSIHIDCMFGNPDMNVDGISECGSPEPVMRDGEFVF